MIFVMKRFSDHCPEAANPIAEPQISLLSKVSGLQTDLRTGNSLKKRLKIKVSFPCEK